MTYETMMTDLLSDPTVRAGLAVLVLLVVASAALFLVARLRDYTNQDREEPQEMLSNFEEMRLRGEITEEEFRTIQSATQTHVVGGLDTKPADDADSPPKNGESAVE